VIITLQDKSWSFLWGFQIFLLLVNFKSFANGELIAITKNGFSLIVNYSIFYLFLLFKVDLKEKQMSAWQFLTKKGS
jgi:hypothetical protein